MTRWREDLRSTGIDWVRRVLSANATASPPGLASSSRPIERDRYRYEDERLHPLAHPRG